MWIRLDKATPKEWLGFLPEILREDDTRPAREQIAERYAHGGGYQPFGEGKYALNPNTNALSYPGEADLKPLFVCVLPASREVAFVYDYAVTCIVQVDAKSFDVVRLD